MKETTLNSNIGIEIFLFANGGAFAVTAIHFGIVGQGEQPCSDGLTKLVEVATGKVGATYATAEKGIASEDPTLSWSIEANASSGMTWSANHLQNAIPHLNYLIILQILVGQVNVADGLHPKPHRLALGLSEIRMSVGMCRHGDAIAMLHGFVAYHMIHVSMGVDHHQRLQLMTVNKAKQTVFF